MGVAVKPGRLQRRSVHCYLTVYCLFTKPDPRVKSSPEQDSISAKVFGKGEESVGGPSFFRKLFLPFPNAFLPFPYFANGNNTVKTAPHPGFRA